MEMTRREFVKESLAYLLSAANRASGGYRSALGFAVLPGGWLFAAPPGWKPKGMPNLVFGVISDTHLRTAVKGNGHGAHWPDKDELPPGKTLTVAVRPLTSLGTSGRPIITDFKV